MAAAERSPGQPTVLQLAGAVRAAVQAAAAGVEEVGAVARAAVVAAEKAGHSPMCPGGMAAAAAPEEQAVTEEKVVRAVPVVRAVMQPER